MKRLIIVAAIVLLNAGLVRANDLTTYKATYEKIIENLTLTHSTQAADLDKKYLGSMNSLLARVKKAGDLDQTRAVMAEIDRFKTEKAMTDTPHTLPAIQAIQVAHKKQAVILNNDRTSKVSELTIKYDAMLERLQKKLTSESKIDEAIAVQDERKRVKSNVSDVATISTDKSTSMSATSTTGFPEGAFEFKKHHYYRLPINYNFADARRICEEFGGHVVAIDSNHEYDVLKKLAVKGSFNLWLDITDEKKEGKWVNWRGARPGFLKWHKGEPSNSGTGENAAVIGADPKKGMIDIPEDRHYAVICEWEPGKKATLTSEGTAGLCELTVKSSRGGSAQILKPGAARLAGGEAGTIKKVSKDLLGAQYLKVPWQSKPSLMIEITKPGYLYVFKGGNLPEVEGAEWEKVPNALSGNYHASGAHRILTKTGQKILINDNTYESSCIAAKITVK